MHTHNTVLADFEVSVEKSLFADLCCCFCWGGVGIIIITIIIIINNILDFSNFRFLLQFYFSLVLFLFYFAEKILG